MSRNGSKDGLGNSSIVIDGLQPSSGEDALRKLTTLGSYGSFPVLLSRSQHFRACFLGSRNNKQARIVATFDAWVLL